MITTDVLEKELQKVNTEMVILTDVYNDKQTSFETYNKLTEKLFTKKIFIMSLIMMSLDDDKEREEK